MVELQCDLGILTIPLKGLCLLSSSSPLTSELDPDELLGIGSDQRLHNSQETVGFIFAYFIPQPRLRSYKPDQHSTISKGNSDVKRIAWSWGMTSAVVSPQSFWKR